MRMKANWGPLGRGTTGMGLGLGVESISKTSAMAIPFVAFVGKGQGIARRTLEPLLLQLEEFDPLIEVLVQLPLQSFAQLQYVLPPNPAQFF